MNKLANLFADLIRNGKRLFHMLVGLTFLCLAAAGATVSFSEWRYYENAPSVGLARFSMVTGFTVLLVIFGLYSFLKARNVR